MILSVLVTTPVAPRSVTMRTATGVVVISQTRAGIDPT